MKLRELIRGLEYAWIYGKKSAEDWEVGGISYDSRTAEKGDLFVCLTGDANDGHRHIQEACIQRGVKVLMVEKLTLDGRMIDFPEETVVLMVKDGREALAYVSAAYFGHPAEKLKVIGITGTKGKTTTACLIRGMLEAAGCRTGLIGTMGIQIGEKEIPIKNTTPQSFTIHKYFAKMVEEGCEYAVMEVSSQGIKQKRIQGIPFLVGVFTNFGEDHIGPGEHACMEEYRYCKSCLFRQCRMGIGNLDDIQWSYMFRRATCEKYGFSCHCEAVGGEAPGKEHVLRAEQIRFLTTEEGPETTFAVDGEEYTLHMPGLFNVYNALAALQVMRCLGVKDPAVKEYLKTAQVKGRMERILLKKKVVCYIDYAHNAMSLENVLNTLRIYSPRRILLVFGCGGNRAKSRRLEMGRTAAKLADFSIVTSDNPRFEEPEKIIEDILTGMKEACPFQKTDAPEPGACGAWHVVCDRAEAVAYAIKEAKPFDVVLIVGKGHETYQEIRGIRYPMDDRGLVERAEQSAGENTLR